MDVNATTGERPATGDLTRRLNADALRLLVESSTDYAIFMLDPDGVIVSWNRGAQRIKGYTADEIIGRHFSSFYTPEDLEAGVPQQALKAAADEGRFAAEGWLARISAGGLGA